MIISILALLQASHLSDSKTFSFQFRSTIQAKFTTISEKIDLSCKGTLSEAPVTLQCSREDVLS